MIRTEYEPRGSKFMHTEQVITSSDFSREVVFYCGEGVAYPPFLEPCSISEEVWHSFVQRLVGYFEERYSGQDLTQLPRVYFTLLLEAVGGFRTGHLGPRRLSFERYMNQNFGEGKWGFEHLLNGKKVDFSEILGLYEEAYVAYFRNNSELVDWLVKNYRDVYDTSPSNVESGEDYQIQETLQAGLHLQDVAIRRALRKLGKTFQGDRLLQVRGKESEGYCLSPGQLPMLPNYCNYKYLPRGWWKRNSIECWYQATRVVTVEGFGQEIIPEHQWSNFRLLGVERVLARFFLALIPQLMKSGSDNQVSSVPFWLLPYSSYPRDLCGKIRPFETSEILHVLEFFLPTYNFLVSALVPSQKEEFKKFNNRAKKIIVELRVFHQNSKANQSELFEKLIERLPQVSQKEGVNLETFNSSSLEFSLRLPEPWRSAFEAFQSTIEKPFGADGSIYRPSDYYSRAFCLNFRHPLHSEELLAVLLLNIYLFNMACSEVNQHHNFGSSI